MEIKFMKLKNKPKFIKGVLFGDSGSGKTTFALNFAIESSKKRNIKDVLLVDTENGWDWIKESEEAKQINIIESDEKITKNNFLNYFRSIEKYVKNNEISCLVVDSVSRVGEFISEKTIDDINTKNEKYKKPKIEDLRYTDWNDIREQQNEIIDILRNLPCDVLLCGRASSDKETVVEDRKSVVVDAKERTLTGWKKITYEFDFTMLADVLIDITKDNIKTFSFLVIKSRIANDGERVKNINHWFDKIAIEEKLSFNEFKEKLENAKNINDLNQIYFKGKPKKDENKEVVDFLNVELEKDAVQKAIQIGMLIETAKTIKNELSKE